jgi:hypothetical protein
MSPREIYLVGSVPLTTAAEVFETVSGKFGTLIKQIPDGEVGERTDWISHLELLFRDNPAFERSEETFSVHSSATRRMRYRLKSGVRLSDVRFEKLGYVDTARASYAEFRRLRDLGRIAPGTRFQVDLVPAHSVIWLFVIEEEQAAMDPIYNAAVVREMQTISETVPHEDLAIQYDVASAVFARLERGEPTPYGRTKTEMADCFSSILADLSNAVLADIPLLFHFCYGDANHKHAIEPTDVGDMVDMGNALTKKISRPINLIHMPVPRDRHDDGYFAPLKGLHLDPATRLILGLIHYTDGLEGTRRRLQTATKYLRDFGVATECGFGRRDPRTLPKLFDLHVAAASDVSGG